MQGPNGCFAAPQRSMASACTSFAITHAPRPPNPPYSSCKTLRRLQRLPSRGCSSVLWIIRGQVAAVHRQTGKASVCRSSAITGAPLPPYLPSSSCDTLRCCQESARGRGSVLCFFRCQVAAVQGHRRARLLTVHLLPSWAHQVRSGPPDPP